MNYLKVAQALVAEFNTLDGAIDNAFDRFAVADAEKLCGVIQSLSANEIRAIRTAAKPTHVWVVMHCARPFIYGVYVSSLEANDEMDKQRELGEDVRMTHEPLLA